MPILNMVGGGQKGGNIGEPLNLTVTAGVLEATITWEDNEIGTIPPTSFQKSELVRKVGSAPTSPSDGTLVVTETVKDTYKTIGYTDSGLTDGTTYYYRVFSYSDLGGISYCDAVSVTPSGGWQPGADTLVYFPFDSDMNDHSGNSRSMTTYGTINLSTSAPNIGTALYISNGSMNSGQFTSNTSLTISGWIYQTQAPLYDNAQVFGFCADSSGGGPSGCNFIYANSSGPSQVSNKPGLAFFNYDPTVGSSAYNISDNTWYYCVAVYDKDTGKTKMYINGQYYTEYTSGRNDSQFYRCISRANGINRSFYGYMSELIGESKARTAQEISDYYNQTKSNYGIS